LSLRFNILWNGVAERESEEKKGNENNAETGNFEQ